MYFADPYSSWQKGAIENANGLVRQYIPKSAAFSNFSQQKITKFTAKINERPRNTKGVLLQKHFVIMHLLVEFAEAILLGIYTNLFIIFSYRFLFPH